MRNLLEKINLNENDLDINKNWNEDQIIRYLYRKLAPYFKRDISYFILGFNERLKRHLKGNFFDGPEVTCRSICEFYHELYNYLGIKSQIIIANRQEIPHYGLLVEGTTGWYYIDPLCDLVSNQLGNETTFFAKKADEEYSIIKRYDFLTHLSADQILELDHSIDLLPCGIYMDDFFKKLHSECANNAEFAEIYNLNPHDTTEVIFAKIDFINTHLANLGSIPGVIERCYYYDYLKQIVFNKNEKALIDVNIAKESGNYFVYIDTNLPNYPNETFRFEDRNSSDGKHSLILRKIPRQKD